MNVDRPEVIFLDLNMLLMDGRKFLEEIKQWQGPLSAGNGKGDSSTKRQMVFDGIVKDLKFLGDDGQILTAAKSGEIPPDRLTEVRTLPNHSGIFSSG